MPACTLCGAPDAPHCHLSDVERAIAQAAPAAWSQTVTDGEMGDVRVRLPDDAITYVCEACLPAYDAAHPQFSALREARARSEACRKTSRPGAPPSEALVTGYIRYAEALSAGVPPETPEMTAAEAAHAEVERAVRRGPAPEAWALTRAILRAAPDEHLGAYAAGLLEDMVRQHGPALVAEIEAEAAADDRFRWALGGVWLEVGEMPAAVLERLVRASGGAIRPLPPRDDSPGLDRNTS